MRFSDLCGAAFAVLGESEPLALELLARQSKARTLVAESLPHARQYGALSNLGVTLRVASLLDGQDPRSHTGPRAVEILEGSGANWSSHRRSSTSACSSVMPDAASRHGATWHLPVKSTAAVNRTSRRRSPRRTLC